MTTVRLKLLPQGNIEQTITVYLTDFDDKVVASASGLLDANGNFEGDVETIEIAVRPIVYGATLLPTAGASLLNPINGVIEYDFTLATSQALGSNQILVDGVARIYNGDFNQDGSIDGSDAPFYDEAVMDLKDFESNIELSISAVLPIGFPIPPHN